ncbi:MAG: hypothetical protein ACOVMN_06625 [Flexibacteraceae bacterium]
MKTKFLIQIPLFFLLVTLIACQSEETNPNTFPAIGETSGNYIAFRFDGNEFVSASRSSTWTSSFDDPFRGTYISNNGRNLSGLLFKYYDTITNSTFTIDLQENPVVNVPIALGSNNSDNSVETPEGSNMRFTYQTTTGYVIDTLFSEALSREYTVGAGSGYDFRTNEIQRGEITFTLIDTINQIYQGTFWADLKFHKNQPRFDVLEPYPSFTDYWNLVAQRTNIDTERIIRVRDGRFYFNPKKPDLKHHHRM